MEIERKLLIEILKLTRNGPILQEKVYRNINNYQNSAFFMIKKLEADGLINLRDGFLFADRLKLAVSAVNLGLDIETVCHLLDWREFEKLAVLAFESNGYSVVRNLRFKGKENRWEIDALGFKKPFIVCVDCKHWRRGLHPSALKQIIEKHWKRVQALAEVLDSLSHELSISSWRFAKLIPAVLSLVPSRFKIYEGVPVVPIFQFQNFLWQLPVNASLLKSFNGILSEKNYGSS